MLSIAKISTNGASYYGSDNYYATNEHEAGEWFGKGAERLGLEGAVNNALFDALVAGRVSGIQLGKVVDNQIKHHPGWDHTFSAPKSVSLLALVGSDERLINAHETAVDTALHYIENNLAQSRFRYGSDIKKEKTGNLAVAKYLHDISRDKDPQLHTHAAVLNITFGHQGELRSLDSRDFYKNKMLVGAIYQSTLAQKVQELG